MLKYTLLLFFGVSTLIGVRAQYMPNPDFSVDGWLDIDVDAYDDVVKVDSVNGQIVFLGQTQFDNSGVFDSDWVVGVLAFDSVVNLFRGDFPGGSISKPIDWVVQNDGVIITGISSDPTVADTQALSIIKLDWNGNLDVSFQHQRLNLIGFHDEPVTIKTVPEGYMVAGRTFDTTANHSEYPFLGKINTDGSIDTTFASSGFLAISFNTGVIDINNFNQDESYNRHAAGGTFNDFLVEEDSSYFVVGTYFNNFNNTCMIMPISVAGNIDSSYHDNGKYTFEIWPGYNEYIERVERLNSGELRMLIQPGAEMNATEAFVLEYNQLLPDTILYTIPFSGGCLTAFDYNDRVVCGNFLSSVNCNSFQYSNHIGVSVWDDLNGYESQFFIHPSNIFTGSQSVKSWSDNFIVGGYSEPNDNGNYTDMSFLMIQKDPFAQIVKHDDESIKLYPIPAQDFIAVEGIIEDCVDYVVYDYTGKSVKMGEYCSNGGINTSDLPSGLYYISLKTGFGKSNQSFMVVQ